jgi:hypothetical protein
VFDPHQQTVWRDEWVNYNRLAGWRRDALTGQYHELVKDEANRLWSEELQSWLKVEGRDLRLYTRDGQLRLTQGEAAQQRFEQRFAKETAERRVARLAELLRQSAQNPDDLI